MARKRQRNRTHEEPGELQMTAMIDVVFQLLVYFIVTIQPQDVITHLDVFRPSPESRQEQLQTPPKMIQIRIFADGITINDRMVTLNTLSDLLSKLASIDTNQTIMIMCTAHSQHEDLISVLDLCAKVGLRNLSVISTN
ncbi:MAG TPA: biopolymer transporter ExbD [Kiritimatiellia bacterium]|nr:biopolymer transporter ExbD [Kiritimatiellia bacterium]